MAAAVPLKCEKYVAPPIKTERQLQQHEYRFYGIDATVGFFASAVLLLVMY